MDDVAPNLLLIDDDDDDDDDERWNDALYPMIQFRDCPDAISAIASIDSSWIHQHTKMVSQNNCNHQQHRRLEGTSLEDKRLECIENFIVNVVKGKCRTGEACWPKTELKLLMSSPSDEKAEDCRAIVPHIAREHRKIRMGGQSRRASTESRHCNRGMTSSSHLVTSLNPTSEKKKDDLGETNNSSESSTKVDALDEKDADNGPTKNKFPVPPFHSEVRANMPKNNLIRRESHDNTSAMSGLTMPTALLSSDNYQPMAGWVIQERQQHTYKPRGGIPRRATMPELSHQARSTSINKSRSPTSSPRTPSSRGKEVLLLGSNKLSAFPSPLFDPKEPHLASGRSNNNRAAAKEPVSSNQQSQVVVPGLPPVARPKSLMVVAEELPIKASKDVGVGTSGGMTTKQLFDNKQRFSSKPVSRVGDPTSSHKYHRKQERTTQTTARNKKTPTTTTARIVSSSDKLVGKIGSGNKTSGGCGGNKKKQLSSNNATATTNTTSKITSPSAALDNKKLFISHWGWRKQTTHRRATLGSTNVTSLTRNNTKGSM